MDDGQSQVRQGEQLTRGGYWSDHLTRLTIAKSGNSTILDLSAHNEEGIGYNRNTFGNDNKLGCWRSISQGEDRGMEHRSALSFSVLGQQQADERSRRRKRERAREMSCGSDYQNWPGLQ
jgi:hypothetical protein